MTEQTQIERAWLIPAEGKKVRRPDIGEYLPGYGAEVMMNRYWRLRLKTGDVKKGTKPKVAAKASKGDK